MVTIKTREEIKILREGGRKLASILDILISKTKPGMTTGELERIACRLISKAGGRPSFKGYKNKFDNRAYPTALCISINDEVVHAPALPSRILREGDIAGIDIGMQYPVSTIKRNAIGTKNSSGLYTDMAATAVAGKVSPTTKKLIDVTRKSLELGIAQVKPGRTINDIGRAIEEYVKINGFNVVRDLVGHGVGYFVHEEPEVPNFVSNFKDAKLVLKSGMVLAIEPMVNAGSHKIESADDGFTIKTLDGKFSAHFEHTIAVTENGCEILTAI
jgi:methionyl aminopeptidase